MITLPPTAKIAELLGGDKQGGQVLCPSVRSPYRLPQLIAAPSTRSCILSRAKKTPITSQSSAFVATTATEAAAAKWDPALTQYFKDRHVVILPDADKPGRKHAQKVAQAINDVAASVRIFDLYSERHDGSDVSNWLADDTAGAKLAKLAKQAPLWEPGTDTVERAADRSGGAVRKSIVAKGRRCLWS
jgi:Toprim-like